MAVPIKAELGGFKAIRDWSKKVFQTGKGPLLPIVHESLSNVWHDAVEEFVITAVRKTHVLTGMSAASYWPLSRAIHSIAAETAVTMQLRTKDHLDLKGMPELPFGHRNYGKWQGISAGRKLGERAYRFNVGTLPRPVFTFSFTGLVYQQSYWEPEWHAIRAGLKAFKEVVERDFLTAWDYTLNQWLKGKKIKPWTSAVTGISHPIRLHGIDV